MSTILEQIQAFTSGTESEYAFPAGLSVEERKLVKVTAEKLGLSSHSFGMGGDRRIHIFKPASSMKATLDPIKYSVKNTFIDGPLDATELQPPLLGPAHQSLPVGGLQEYLAAEEESFPAVSLLKVTSGDLIREASAGKSSDVDTGSTVDSDSDPRDPTISIKNTFVHFEADSADPRIVQSMPSGMFASNVEAERAEAAANVRSQKERPTALAAILHFFEKDETESERICNDVFPSTPDAENVGSFGALDGIMATTATGHAEAVPVVQWIPPMTNASESVTVLPPAYCAPSVPCMQSEGFAAAVSVAQQQAPVPAVAPAAAPAPGAAPAPAPAPAPFQGTPQELPQGLPSQGPPQEPQGLPQGMPVVLQGLANQNDFNGLRGVVDSFDAKCGRYNVMIEIGQNRRLVKVKSQNLLPAQANLPAQPYCYPSAQVMSRPGKTSLALDQMV